ncbi:hypothetical protein AB1Y20_011906 [Prymnesium parvum]|uniref:Thioredoxin domain-containing protein n=1 Tax=Prymnesium parvum TaxID=97485 RepID=A0AB34IKI3_PRYPA|mmetsp:Transcript_37061/g.85008  ORF Transcript_37061/g.85008 Transcript_37061/m.85008 type:complete len:183 (-) Transcript_37061:287-835(-)
MAAVALLALFSSTLAPRTPSLRWGRRCSLTGKVFIARAGPVRLEEGKYGVDPRDSSAGEPLAFESGRVGRLHSSTQLTYVVNTAAEQNRFVVLKFRRDGCAACASTVEAFLEASERYASTGYFFEVDYDQARPFCKQCKLRIVPAGHIYARGVLQAALPMGKSTWNAFAEHLGRWHDEFNAN